MTSSHWPAYLTRRERRSSVRRSRCARRRRPRSWPSASFPPRRARRSTSRSSAPTRAGRAVARDFGLVERLLLVTEGRADAGELIERPLPRRWEGLGVRMGLIALIAIDCTSNPGYAPLEPLCNQHSRIY